MVKIGFGLTAFIDDNVSGNKNGAYKIQAFKRKNLVSGINLIFFDDKIYKCIDRLSKYKKRIKRCKNYL
jgi:pimeloyl-CoA synthetase